MIDAVPSAAVVAAIVLAAAGNVAAWGIGASGWYVQTDELQYVRLALSAVEGAPGQVHGVRFGGSTQLFALLLAPIYAVFSVPNAFAVAQALMILVMASAAIPAYLLARAVVAGRVAAYVVSFCCVFVVWIALSFPLWTESLAYPVFLWVVLAMVRAVDEPSAGRDLVALVAIGLAVTVRTQFLVFAVGLPVVVVGYEFSRALAQRGDGTLAGALAGGLRAAVTRHLVLVAASVVAGLALLLGALDTVLGPYSGTVGQARVFPPGVRDVLLTHLAIIAVASGVLPMVLALAWWPAALVRPRSEAARAFAWVSLVVAVLLVIQAASFVVTNVGAAPNDRYFFYIVPLLLVAGGAFLTDGPRHWALVLGAGAVLAWLVARTPFGSQVLFIRSPAGTLDPVIRGQLGRVQNWVGADGVALGDVMRVLVAALAVVLTVAVARWSPRRLAAVVGVALMAWSVAASGYGLRQFRDDRGGIPARDWVDRAVGAGAEVGVAPSRATNSATAEAEVRNVDGWWGVEFWNKSIRRSYGYEQNALYTPFPARLLSVRPDGRLTSQRLPRYLVVAANRVDLGIQGRTVARDGALRLVDVGPRPRVSFAAEGMVLSGTGIRPGGAMLLRTFGRARSTTRVAFRLKVPPPLDARQRYSVSAGGRRLSSGVLVPRRSRDVSVCLPPGQRMLSVFSGEKQALYLDAPSGLIVERMAVRSGARSCARSRR